MEITDLQLSVKEYSNKVYAVMGNDNVYYISGAPSGVAKLTFKTTYTGSRSIFTLWHSSDGVNFSKADSYTNFSKNKEIILSGGKGVNTYYKITATLDGNEYESEVSKALIKNTQPNPPTIDKLIYIPYSGDMTKNVEIQYEVKEPTGKNITVRYGFSPLEMSFNLADGVTAIDAGRYWTKATIYVVADDGLMTSSTVPVDLRRSNKKPQITGLIINENESVKVTPFSPDISFEYYSQIKVRVNIDKGDGVEIDYFTFNRHGLTDEKADEKDHPYVVKPELKKDDDGSFYFEESIQLEQHSKGSLYKISCCFITNYNESSDEVWFGKSDKVDNPNYACVFCCLKKPTKELMEKIFSVEYRGSKDINEIKVDTAYNKYVGAWVILAPTIRDGAQLELTQLPYCTFSINYIFNNGFMSSEFQEYEAYEVNPMSLRVERRDGQFITPFIRVKFNESIFAIYGANLSIFPSFSSKEGIKIERQKWSFFEEKGLSFLGKIQLLNYAKFEEVFMKWGDKEYKINLTQTKNEDEVRILIDESNNETFLNFFRNNIYKIGGNITANLSLIITDVFGYKSTIEIEPFIIDFEITPSLGDSAISFFVKLKGENNYTEVSNQIEISNRILNKGEELKIVFTRFNLPDKIKPTLINDLPNLKIKYEITIYGQEGLTNLPINPTGLKGNKITTFTIKTNLSGTSPIEQIYKIPMAYDNIRALYATVDAKIDGCSTKSSLLKITNPANTCVWVGVDNILSCNCSLTSISDSKATISITNFNFGDSRYINRDYKNHRWLVKIKLLDENKTLLASNSNLEITDTSINVPLEFDSKINGMTGRKHFYIQIDFINNGKEIDGYGILKEVIYIFDSPLISGRPSTIGVNAFLDELEDIAKTVVAIGATQSKNQLILIPSNSDKISTINIDTGEMTNFIINCGTWDD